MSPELATQTAIRLRLVATPAVVALVPAASILDRHARPAPDPSVILGEDIAVDDGRLSRAVLRVFSTLHIWRREPGLAGTKAIAGAIRDAVHAGRLPDHEGWQFGDCYVSSTRFLRDPDGETAHGIVTIETIAVDKGST